MSPSPVAPQIVGDVTFTKNTPEEGESTTATCQWTGEPEPTVTWYKDGEELVEADLPDHIRIVITMEDGDKHSELRIEEVQSGNAGNYACNVSNLIGFDSQTKRLEVQAISDTCVYFYIVTVCPYISVTLITQQAPPLDLAPSAQELVLSLDSPYWEYLCWLGVWSWH